MRRLLAGLAMTAISLSAVPSAVAGERDQPQRGIFAADRLEPFVRAALEKDNWSRAQGPAGRAPNRDSIVNGGLIGAAIGGVGGSALIVASRGGSDDIPRAMLNVCAVPALAGFAAGAIIDALR